MKSFKQFKNQLLKDPKIKVEYDKLTPEYQLVQAVIKKRIQRGLSQSQLAKKAGTQQSAISRLESGRYNPSLTFLTKIAKAFDSTINISFQ
ncbi:helix-turn-helix domain-containing protein [Patescibacteria group bacterium]|nr:helix-turn-helix domain-containing protein [Patescibacteria group bacterium]MBU1256151.1 helix-turn-helix domain-containing protein [Patescibacteria group bacterium]MBU1457907.1 helix-turn-helix domain-containing protein [Patescibacteria group bacterium]